MFSIIEQTNDKLKIAETLMLQEPQVDCPVKHHFGEKTYVRETFMPAGTVAIGKKHRYEIVNILLKGKMLVLNGSDEPEYAEAPCIFKSKAGVKKAAYFIEDTVWLNVHYDENNSKDVELIEKEVIIPEEPLSLEEITKLLKDL